jgi:uncharacterized membrane protein YfcA
MKPIWRSVLAVVGGYLVTAVLVVVLVSLATMATRARAGEPNRAYLVLNLAGGLVAAMIGGLAASRIAPSAPMRHVLILAGIILLAGLTGVASPQPGQPSWYPYALLVIGPAGAYVGGLRGERTRNRAAST